MADLIGPVIGAIRTFLGWDGTSFRPVHVDAAGDLQVDVLPFGRGRRDARLWDTNIAAGATHALLATTLGKGYLTNVMIMLNGNSALAADSKVRVTLDGTYICDFEPSAGVYLSNGATGNYCNFDLVKYDTVNFDYWAHWCIRIPFHESIKIDIMNNDGVNLINVRCKVVYQIE